MPVTLAPGIEVSPAPDPLNCDPVTVPEALIRPTVVRLPTAAVPLTVKVVSVPTLVILPCAAVVTVPATTAVVAFGTVPVTLAPGILVRPAPDPLNCDPVICPVTDTKPPVKLAPFTIVVAITLLALRLPVNEVEVPAMEPIKLPPLMLPVVEILPVAAMPTVTTLPELDTVAP